MIFADALEEALEEHVRPIADPRRLSPAERRQALPLELRQELAAEIARREGIQRRSAMRRIQRYITEAGEIRKPGAKILEAMARQRVPVTFRRGIDVLALAAVAVRVSKDCRIRTIETLVHIPPDDARPILDAWLAGESERAAQLFERAYGKHYGIAGLEIGCPETPEEEEIDDLVIAPA